MDKKNPFLDEEAQAHLLNPYAARHKSVSMGCKVREPVCPICEAEEKERMIKRGKDLCLAGGVGPVSPQATTLDMIQCDYEHLEMRILAGLGVPKELFDLYNRKQVSRKTLLAHTHDCMDLDVEESDEKSRRLVGIDFGDDGGNVVVTGVVKRLGEPNKNGDVFEIKSLEHVHLQGEVRALSKPKYVGKFPVHRDAQPVNKTAARIKALTDQYAETVNNDPHHVPQTTQKWGPSPLTEVMKLQMQLDILQRAFPPMYALHVPSDLSPKEMQKIREYFDKLKKDPTNIPILPQGVTIEPIETIDQQVRKHPAVANLIIAQDHANVRYKDAEARANHDEMRVWGDRIHQLYRERQRVEARVFQELRADMDNKQCQQDPAEDPPRPDRPVCIRDPKQFSIENEECEECSYVQECSFHTCNQPKCPECGSSMLLRQAKHGPMVDDWFWGCSNFPDCKETRTHNEVLGIFTGLHSIEIEQREAGYVGFEAYDSYKQELIYGRSIKAKEISASNLLKVFIVPCARAFNVDVNEVAQVLFEALDVEWDGGILNSKVFGPGRINMGKLESALRKSPVLASIEGTKASLERSLQRVTCEVYDHHIELRVKSKTGQTLCGVKTMRDLPMTSSAVMDCLITPFLARTTTALAMTKAQVLQAVIDGLEGHTHPTAKFVLDVANQSLLRMSLLHPAAVAGKAMADGFKKMAEGVDRYFKPKGTVTGRFPSNSLRDKVKNIPYNAPPPHACSSDVAALEEVRIQGQVLSTAAMMERCYSPQTLEFIKEQKKLAPQKEKERLKRLHKTQEDERKLEKRTRMYPPTYCTKCHRTGCMCPRPMDVYNEDMLHSCKDNKHVRVVPIPLPQQNDLGLERGEWTYCLDCFEILQDGRPTGRKVSTLRAP